MHYYQFNIGDYHSHTSHLDPLEDIAYRRMIDWCFLHERQLPNNTEEIARLIRMRSHCECIAVVLREFFTATDDGYFSSRIQKEIDTYAAKSKKAKESADARWAKHKGLTDANALRTECERNANQEPRTKNHKPITKNQKKKEEALPLSLNMNAWDEFVLHRTQINKPMKALAKTKAVNILKDLPFDQQQNVVDYSIAGGYTGLFANQSQNNRGNGSAERVIPEYIPEGQRDGISVINSTAERVND